MVGTSTLEEGEHRLWHSPVMADVVTSFLITPTTRVIVDCTVGTAGHALEMLKAASDEAVLIGIDMDRSALQIASERLASFGDRVMLRHGNFADLPRLVGTYTGQVDALLIDCGISKLQIVLPDRGFSFDQEGRLDMRFDTESSVTAAQVLGSISFPELRSLLSSFGESRAGAIARSIIRRRERGELSTTADLAGAVKAVVKTRQAKSLARVFLAIRAYVNRELENLRLALEVLKDVLSKGGRACVVTYHSAEDVIVKTAFRKYSGKCVCPPGAVACTCGKAEVFKLLTRKPLVPSADEIRANPSARSAKIRVVEKM